MAQSGTTQSQLLGNLVRCVRKYTHISIPFINLEQRAEQFALEHPEESEQMIKELYSLLNVNQTNQHK